MHLKGSYTEAAFTASFIVSCNVYNVDPDKASYFTKSDLGPVVQSIVS